jgi:hypothetical protein
VLAPAYRPRRPTETVLYALVREHLETFLAHARASYGPLPRYVEAEFRQWRSSNGLRGDDHTGVGQGDGGLKAADGRALESRSFIKELSCGRGRRSARADVRGRPGPRIQAVSGGGALYAHDDLAPEEHDVLCCFLLQGLDARSTPSHRIRPRAGRIGVGGILAVELAPSNVRVNVGTPGPVTTVGSDALRRRFLGPGSALSMKRQKETSFEDMSFYSLVCSAVRGETKFHRS